MLLCANYWQQHMYWKTYLEFSLHSELILWSFYLLIDILEIEIF